MKSKPLAQLAKKIGVAELARLMKVHRTTPYHWLRHEANPITGKRVSPSRVELLIAVAALNDVKVRVEDLIK